MSAEENKALLRRYLEEAWNNGNLAIVDELVDPTYNQGRHPTRDEEKQSITGIRTTCPDFNTTIEDMIAEGDKVVVREVVRGTQQGEMKTVMGIIPPTGKQLTMSLIVIFRIANGKLIEAWAQGDELGLLQQLGAIPS
jgi:predicted ester cyclase